MGCRKRQIDGMTVIVCARGDRRQACRCGRPSTRLCDWPLRGKAEGRTCSAPLCDRCTSRRGEVDHCPAHAKMAAREAR